MARLTAFDRRQAEKRLGALPPELKSKAEGLIAELEKAYTENPLLRYQPHPKQALFHASRARTKCFFGGNRAGKTTAGVLDNIIQAIDREVVPDHLIPYKKFEPPFYCRMVAPGFDIMEAVLFQKLREWVPRGQLVGNSWEKAYEKSKRLLHFKNGSYFDFLTYEQDIDKFTGAAKHRIHYDEEPSEAIRNEGKFRLIDYKGADELFTMTPTEGLTHTYDTIWEPWTKRELKNAYVIVVDMDDNPHLDPEQKAMALADLSLEEREARKSGKFVAMAGLIYPDFSKTRHVIPEGDIPQGNVYVGIDPGQRFMAAVVWVYVAPDADMIVFDELAMERKTVAEVAEQIKMTNMKWKIARPNWYVIDPAARSIFHQTGRSDQDEYARHGINTIQGQNSVTAGINHVRERLQHDKLHIMANCTETIYEFAKYRWTKKSKVEGDEKEKPVKTDDHCLDALRYVVSSLPRPSEIIKATDELDVWQKAMKRDLEAMERKKPKADPVFGQEN